MVRKFLSIRMCIATGTDVYLREDKYVTSASICSAFNLFLKTGMSVSPAETWRDDGAADHEGEGRADDGSF